MKQSCNSSSVVTIDSDERGPMAASMAGVAGSCLCGTAAPLRGMHSRREAGRPNRSSRCSTASEPGGSIGLADGCVWRVHSSVRMQQPKATCASRADDSRRRALHQGQLRRPGQGLSQSGSLRRRTGSPADETRHDGGRGAQ